MQVFYYITEQQIGRILMRLNRVAQSLIDESQREEAVLVLNLAIMIEGLYTDDSRFTEALFDHIDRRFKAVVSDLQDIKLYLIAGRLLFILSTIRTQSEYKA